MPAPYTGGCQCGAVRYVLTAEPIRTVACHCKECQRQSGSAFGMSMIVPQDSLTVTGPTKSYVRIADSGNRNEGVFCPECGGRIYQIPLHFKDVLVLKPGTLDDTSWVRPGYFVWMSSCQGWVPIPPGVVALDGQT
ncbi:MAG: GFA family protein [Caulobacteraceae bacterium]|nr:GFA family protein [Caulobacteraceae bacterium]